MGLSITNKIFAAQAILIMWGAGLLSSTALANHHHIAINEDRVNLSAADFLPEFINKTPERRVAARLYLLGVLDTTEGKTWCSYNLLKTATINEFVFEYLNKQPQERLKLRASVLIEEALKHHFPCKDTK